MAIDKSSKEHFNTVTFKLSCQHRSCRKTFGFLSALLSKIDIPLTRVVITFLRNLLIALCLIVAPAGVNVFK